MTHLPRRFTPLLALLIGLLAPSGAAAAVRYAVPQGGNVSSPACAADDPCTLPGAIAMAQEQPFPENETVMVTPGTYTEGPLTISKGIVVMGDPALERPRILDESPGAAITVDSPDRAPTLRHLFLEQAGFEGAALNAGDAVLEDLRLLATAGSGTGAILREGALLRDSVAQADDVGGAAVVVRQAPVLGAALRHVTAIADGPGGTGLVADAGPGPTLAVVENSILRGAALDIAGTANGARVSSPPTGAAITTDHSNYRPDRVQLAGGASHDAGPGDQSADPLFAAGDPMFHEAGGSPTIDAGASDPAAGAQDIDGQARVQGPAPDIGADETLGSTTGGTGGTGGTGAGGGDSLLPVAPGPDLPTGLPVVELLGVGVPGDPPIVGRPTQLRLRVSDPDDPVNGAIVDFGERGGHAGGVACRPGPVPTQGAFAPNRTVEIAVPYRFRTAGEHTVTVQVVSGACTGTPDVATRTLTVTPEKPSAATTRAAAAQAAQATCADANLMPKPGLERRVAKAAVCLMNMARRAAGQKALRSSRPLGKAARAHTKDMVRRRFYAHEGPGGPRLSGRLRKVRFRRPAGENLGTGGGSLATPQAMLEAWLASPPHKANILRPSFRQVGVGIAARMTIDPFQPAATYTVDFGR